MLPVMLGRGLREMRAGARDRSRSMPPKLLPSRIEMNVLGPAGGQREREKYRKKEKEKEKEEREREREEEERERKKGERERKKERKKGERERERERERESQTTTSRCCGFGKAASAYHRLEPRFGKDLPDRGWDARCVVNEALTAPSRAEKLGIGMP